MTDESGARGTPTRPKRLPFSVHVLAALSIAGAFALARLQGAALGDQPMAMLTLGFVLAFAAAGLGLAHPIPIGTAAMLGFPVQAIADYLLHGGHDLLPLELALHAAYGALAVLLAAGTRRLRALTGRWS